MSSSESSSSTTISSKQDPIELEKKSHDKSHSKSKSGSSSSSAKPVHEAETQRVSKELLREEQHHKEGHKEAHKEHQPAVPVKQEVQIDKKKKASEGKVWVGTDDHPQTEEVATADMTGEHLAKLFGFKTIKYLVSHDNEYIPPDANNSFVSRVKYGMSYLIAGLEEYEDKCIRCRKLFNLKQKKTCRYHPGERVLIDLSKNKKKKKKKGEEEFVPEPTLTEVWSCCKEEEIISSGCCKVKGHVGMIEKNFKPKPLGEEPLDPQYDTKKISQARKKREAKMEKFKPWQKPAVDTKGVAPGAPAANTNQKASAPKPVAQEEFKLKEKPVVEEVHVEKSDNKPAASSDDSSSESASSSSSSSVSSSSTKSD